MTNCEWREKIGLYVDGELEPGVEEAVAGHLPGCTDCAAAVLEQQELKKVVRIAAKRYSAPPELYASVRKQMAPQQNARSWWKLSAIAASAVSLAIVALSLFTRPSAPDATLAQLTDLHVTMLASANPVDVVSSNKHVVKPWFQGKVPFTFNPPMPSIDSPGSPYTLIGGKVVYMQKSPGAELVYQVGQHKMSVFIFQARDVHGEPTASHTFAVTGWQQSGLQYYIVTDASRADADRLRALMEEANKQ